MHQGINTNHLLLIHNAFVVSSQSAMTPKSNKLAKLACPLLPGHDVAVESVKCLLKLLSIKLLFNRYPGSLWLSLVLVLFLWAVSSNLERHRLI